MGEVTREAFIETFEANVLAPYLLMQSALPIMFPGGSIINITSISGRVSLGGPTVMLLRQGHKDPRHLLTALGSLLDIVRLQQSGS